MTALDLAGRWRGEIVTCLASGPSLTAEDAALVRGVTRVIAINDAVRLAPWADALYSSDGGWWTKQIRRGPAFEGLKLGIERHPKQGAKDLPKGLVIYRNTGVDGVDDAPDALRTARHSGGAAVQAARHLGASRIVLLGYDLSLGPDKRKHFCDEVGQPIVVSPFRLFQKQMEKLATDLAARGVSVINCSRRTALTCFPRMELTDALAREVAA